jgi:hypothetical protein
MTSIHSPAITFRIWIAVTISVTPFMIARAAMMHRSTTR